MSRCCTARVGLDCKARDTNVVLGRVYARLALYQPLDGVDIKFGRSTVFASTEASGGVLCLLVLCVFCVFGNLWL